MSTKHNANQTEIDRLAKKLADLVKMFRQGKPADDFEWWNENSPRSIFYPVYGYQDGQPLFELVVQGVLTLNPEMLSKYEVETKLVYSFLNEQTVSVCQSMHLSNQSLVSEAKQHLSKLIEFKAWQNIDIPIGNLWLEGKPVELGHVTFMAITEQELIEWKKDPSPWPKKPDVHVVARVNAPGDLEKAVSYTKNQVNLALNILRAFCFPFGKGSEHWKVGFIGDYIFPGSTPIRINGKAGTYLLSPPTILLELSKHILSKLGQPQWELIKKLILKAESSQSKMERKLLDGIHWLAEATKPDTNRAKFAKISIALEALLGGEPKDNKYLQIRGITATLAERAAFIAGTNHDDMLAIDKNVQKHSRRRGGVMHGDAEDVPLNEIDEFGELVRRIALALLEKLDELGDKMKEVTKLEEWARSQRYTLPKEDK